MADSSVRWTDDLAIGDDKIDSEHQALFRVINKFTDTVAENNIELGFVRETLHFLYIYATEHFPYEEEYIRHNNLHDNIEKQRMLHAKFIAFFQKFTDEMDRMEYSGHIQLAKLEDLSQYAVKFLNNFAKHLRNFINSLKKNKIANSNHAANKKKVVLRLREKSELQ